MDRPGTTPGLQKEGERQAGGDGFVYAGTLPARLFRGREPTPMADPALIDTREGLEALVQELLRHPLLGVDTEGNSFFVYQERLCLLQFSTEEEDYLLDTLAGLDYSPLKEVLENGKILKIFHDGEQDVVFLKRDLGIGVRGIFDTKVAGAGLGDGGVGLANLAERRLGIVLDKKCQRSNWGKRPLSAEQLRYAVGDTRHLIALYRSLRADLEKADPLVRRLVEGEFRRLETLEPPRKDPGDEFPFLKVRKAGNLGPRGLRNLAELYRARDGEARRRDLPPGRVLSDKALYALSRYGLPPRGKELEEWCGLPRRSLKRQAPWIRAALERASRMEPLALPAGRTRKGRRRDPELEAFQEALEKIRAWRKQKALDLGVEPSLVLNRKVMEEMARRKPSSRGEVEEIAGMELWRVEAFGGELVEALRGDSPRPRGRRRPKQE